MKLFTSMAAAVLVISSATVGFAENIGDVTGAVYHSALDTYINNYPIAAYHYEGRQLICAEDLRDYGFSVIWDQASRSLYIERDKSITAIS